MIGPYAQNHPMASSTSLDHANGLEVDAGEVDRILCAEGMLHEIETRMIDGELVKSF